MFRTLIQCFLCAGAIALAVAGLSCGTARGPGAGPLAADEIRLDLRAQTDGDGVRVVATVRNSADMPVYVCQRALPRCQNPKGSEPFVYYGGAETIVLWWAMVQEPGCGYVMDESAAMLGAYVIPVVPGAETTLCHRLEPVVRERNAWMLRLCGDASQPGETFRISRVLVVIGYWQHGALAATRTRVVLPKNESFYLPHWATNVQTLDGLPVDTCRESVTRAIREQRPGFEQGLALGDMQLLVIAGPIPLPKPIAFEPVWVEPKSAAADQGDVLYEKIFGEPRK